jgi:hypothetical protein
MVGIAEQSPLETVIVVGCDSCLSPFSVCLDPTEYAMHVMDWREGAVFVPRPVDDSAGGVPDSEIVGRLVQGWRIDLDAVVTPADMELFWDHQEKTDPGSVPVEGVG